MPRRKRQVVIEPSRSGRTYLVFAPGRGYSSSKTFINIGEAREYAKELRRQIRRGELEPLAGPPDPDFNTDPVISIFHPIPARTQT